MVDLVEIRPECLEKALYYIVQVGLDGIRKGTNGVSTSGVTANLMLLTETFWVLPLTFVYFPESARAYLFPQSVKKHYFCSGPISVDPICPQPRHRVALPVHVPSPRRGP